MDVQRLILFGMVAAVFALVLKSMKSEWGQLLSPGSSSDDSPVSAGAL